MTTTAQAGSLRALAIADADEADRVEGQRRAEQNRRDLERIVAVAGREAVGVLGESAAGTRWTALDARHAQATIGGERFRFRATYDTILYHVRTCARCGGDELAPVGSREDLGRLLRDAARPTDAYRCETCAEAAQASRVREQTARHTATAALPPLPTREEVLRKAVHAAERAGEEGRDDSGYMAALAALSQAWSAVARMTALTADIRCAGRDATDAGGPLEDRGPCGWDGELSATGPEVYGLARQRAAVARCPECSGRVALAADAAASARGASDPDPEQRLVHVVALALERACEAGSVDIDHPTAAARIAVGAVRPALQEARDRQADLAVYAADLHAVLEEMAEMLGPPSDHSPTSDDGYHALAVKVQAVLKVTPPARGRATAEGSAP